MYPQSEALTVLRGIGRYTAVVVIGERGDVRRFRRAKQVASYAGLTARVNQSGEHCYHGHISKQGSPWLRWLLIEAAMKLVQQDVALANFYQRIRKRSSAKIARVAAATEAGGDLLEAASELGTTTLSRGSGSVDIHASTAVRTQKAEATRKFASGEVLRTGTVIMSGCSSPVNETMCDGKCRTARMGDYDLRVVVKRQKKHVQRSVRTS